jgi:cobalamin biosynthesis protein CobW
VLANQSRLNGHAHSGISAHTHGLATHKHFHEQDPGWLSFTLRSSAPQQTDKLKAALLAAVQQEPLLRIKGFIRSEDSANTVLVQAVRSRLVISADAAKPAPHKSELVFIGYHANRANIAALLSEHSGTTWR